MSDYRERGPPPPGIRDNDGTLRVNLSHIAKVLDTAQGTLDAPSNRAVLAEMGQFVIVGPGARGPSTNAMPAFWPGT